MRAYGQGGWVRFEREAGLPGVLYLRFDAEGKVVELHMVSKGDITAADLRGLPLARVKAGAVSRLDILLGLITRSPDPEVLELLESAFPVVSAPPVDISARLTSGPPTGAYTDQFLHDVARAYLAAVARGERPNNALLEQVGDGYSKRTIERWVYIARRRGFLHQTRAGSVA